MGVNVVLVLHESMHFSQKYALKRFSHFRPRDFALTYDLVTYKVALSVSAHVRNLR